MTTEKAILAGGCFWGMQDLIRKRPGILKTRVGYTGGDVKNATYRNHGSHAEGIEITFDPAIVSYRQILNSSFRFTIQRQRTAKAMMWAGLIAQRFIMKRSSRKPWLWTPSRM